MQLPIIAGDVIDNTRLTEIFLCSTQGGMRKSNKLNALVLIANHVKSIYNDQWKDDILNYTGMGTQGDQSLTFMQNKTLAESSTNGISLHLFEVHVAKQYTYVGKVKLAKKPYQEQQSDTNGQSRMVWIFPLQISEGEIVSRDVFDSNWSNTTKAARLLDNETLRQKATSGENTPTKITIISRITKHNPFVAEYARRIAAGRCQLCNAPAPFTETDGTPYLESHHIVSLPRGGSDTIDNVIALCPNCHRKMHIIANSQDEAILKERVKVRHLPSEKNQ